MRSIMFLGVSAVGIAAVAGAWGVAEARQQSPYAAQHAGVDDPLLKHLTLAQIEGLRSAKGLGLAKPAELHGMPGPTHALELAERLELTDAQRGATQEAYERMRERAIPAGRRVLDAERRVGAVMAARPTVIDGDGARALDAAADAWRDLARIHIEAHAAMVTILTPEQVARYGELRGYTEAAPR